MSFDFDSEEIGRRFDELERRVDKLAYSRLVHGWSIVFICVSVLALLWMGTR